MSNEVTVTVKGWAGSNVNQHVGPSGGRMTNFRLGVTARYYSRAHGEHRDAPTQWFTVKCWGELGENVAESVVKGSPVLVRGRLVTETWRTEEGAERFTNVIHAESVGIELGKGTAKYVKVSRNSQEADDTERVGGPVAAEGDATAPSPALAGRGAGEEADPWSRDYGAELTDEPELEPAG